MLAPDGLPRTLARLVLGAFLLAAGVAHLARPEPFAAQVPPWLPVDVELVVLASGIVEIVLGAAVLLAPRAVRPVVGLVTAVFFVAVFPGNVAQYVEGRDAFGLRTDAARLTRLAFQPLLVLWAWWALDASRAVRRSRS